MKLNGNISIANRDEDGNVIIHPRNILTKNVKRGSAIDAVLFDAPSYNAVGDPYKAKGDVIGRKTDRERIMAAGHEMLFKPTKTVKERLYRHPYAHMAQTVQVKKNFRDEEGAIQIGPRNIQTNPMKRGKVGKNTTFQGTIPYIEDEFSRPHEFELKRAAYHRSKVQDKPFSQNARRLRFGTFNSRKDVYDIKDDIKDRPPLARVINSVEHERAFRPSNPPKRGKENSTIEKFPIYKENPPTELTRKKEDPDADERPKFKMTTKTYSRPTPSIVCNMKNLKQSFPSVFQRGSG